MLNSQFEEDESENVGQFADARIDPEVREEGFRR